MNQIIENLIEKKTINSKKVNINKNIPLNTNILSNA